MTKLVFFILASISLLLGCQADTEVVVDPVATAKVTTKADDVEPVASESSGAQTADASMASVAENAPEMEVAVFRDGSVEIDGEKLGLEAAIATIKSVSGSDTMVYYYREAPQEEPHPNAMTIITTVVESGLSLAFSSEPDFSTVVAPDTGEIFPRN